MRPRATLNLITGILLVGVLLSGFSVVLAKPAFVCSIAEPNCKVVLFLSLSVEEKSEEHNKACSVLAGITLSIQHVFGLRALRPTPLVNAGCGGSVHSGRQLFIAWHSLRI